MRALLPFPGPQRAPAAPDFRSTQGRRAWRWTTFGVSTVGHAVLISAILVLPLFTEEPLLLAQGVRAFLVAPPEIAPPPPPPALAPMKMAGGTGRQQPAVQDHTLRVPTTDPGALRPEDPGLEPRGGGGDPNGVEGGDPSGVSGAIVGGLSPTTPPPKQVRVGGNIKAPRLVRRVDPVYPELARRAHITGKVSLEALVDQEGNVRDVQVVSGTPLLVEAAVTAVRQWRYQPLFLNGEAHAFTLAVDVTFGLR
jgi:periplasmic protein TonB